MTRDVRPALRSRARAARAAAIGSVPHEWYRSAGASSVDSVFHQPRTVCGHRNHDTNRARNVRRTRVAIGGRFAGVVGGGAQRYVAAIDAKIPLGG